MSKRTFVSLAFCLAGIFALYGQEENHVTREYEKKMSEISPFELKNI